MSALFTPLKLRDVELRNRIAISPMCQYSAEDGLANEWHMVHLGSRAIGGAGLVVLEATAVEARGRISPGDLGLWNDDQIEPLARIRRFLNQHGAAAAIQLAHAGRKASTDLPWRGGAPLRPDQGGWDVVAPSAIPFDHGYSVPQVLSFGQIGEIVDAFVAAARRALDAGFQIIELHGAHGYLIHEFLSPLTNHRDDEYGGSFDNRTRFLREIISAVRQVWPERLPIFLRISASDWTAAGWTPEDSVALARKVGSMGVDLIDCSSGGIAPGIRIPVGPGYQVPFAARVRREAGVPSGAVGLITEPAQAENIVAGGEADLVLLARASLRDPYWPVHAALQLDSKIPAPVQYGRAFA